MIEMARSAPHEHATLITENLIRRFWVGYQKLMGFETPAIAAE
jgi:anthranilate 1,2-dioxygenase large subunit